MEKNGIEKEKIMKFKYLIDKNLIDLVYLI